MGRKDKVVPIEPNRGEVSGPLLRQLRQSRGVSLGELARSIGYSKGHLSSIETGRVRIPGDLIDAYAKALSISIAGLFPPGDNLLSLPEPPGELEPEVRTAVRSLIRRMSGGLEQVGDLEVASTGEVPAYRASGSDRVVVLRGIDTVLRAACSMLWQASRSSPLPGEEIVITLPPELELAGSTAGQEWRYAVRSALETGWDVVHLIDPDPNGLRRLRLITQMIDFLGCPGRYQPYVAPPASVSRQIGPLVLVPGEAALLAFPVHQSNGFASAFLLKGDDELNALRDHIDLLRSRATPFMRIYTLDKAAYSQADPRPPLDLLRFDFAYTRSETQLGDRFLVKDGLSLLTLPDVLYQEWARRLAKLRGDEWAEWVRTLLEHRLQRTAAFRDQVANWKFRDITSKRAVERMVSVGAYPDADWLGVPVLPQAPEVDSNPSRSVLATPAERAHHIETVIEWLKTYPNYDVALVDDPTPDEMADTYWWVKGSPQGGSIFLHSWYQGTEGRVELRIEITDPFIVNAFHRYFREFWEQIPAENRNRRNLIGWLQDQLDRIPMS